ncbi:hypothetical protein B0H17DRAFT_1330368 [Mycena rosella]|uniref:Uncharacterized protein n=1 Tax=Mycena rosella TaxID=1033263 RepID=A0AAD7DMD2_MYCRO|nr:hypothetical protein B0H17DRAFT_1330368 [Mycena rosella]
MTVKCIALQAPLSPLKALVSLKIVRGARDRCDAGRRGRKRLALYPWRVMHLCIDHARPTKPECPMVGIVHKCPRLLERRASDCDFRVAAGTRPIPPSKGRTRLVSRRVVVSETSAGGSAYAVRVLGPYYGGLANPISRSDMGRTIVEDAYQTCFAARRRVRNISWRLLPTSEGALWRSPPTISRCAVAQLALKIPGGGLATLVHPCRGPPGLIPSGKPVAR